MKRVHFIMAFMVVAVLAMSPSTQAITLEFAPTAQGVALGNLASVDVNVSGLTGALALGAYDLNINYNSAILSTPAVTFGTGLNLGVIADSTTGTLGSNPLNIFEVSLVLPATLSGSQADSFKLFTVVFNTIGVGTSPLGFSDVILGDQEGESLGATLGSGSIQVTALPSNGGGNPIPEPGTWLLMSTGMLTLGLWRRKLAVACV
jgi:hypothetical protein